ncbi:MAG: alpha-amylase family glycosyl hydrolase, partial [Bradymonadia bacterium]
ETNTVSDGLGGQNSQREVICEGGTSNQCGDPDAFDWRDAVMYFAMVDRFYDGDGMRTIVDGATDGDAANGPSGQFHGGDLPGVTEKLAYLQELGVTALWLSAPYKNRDYRGASMNPCVNGNQEGCDPNFYSAYHGYWPSPDNVDYSDPETPNPIPMVEPRLGTTQDLHTLVDTAHDRGMKILFDYVMNHIDVASPLYEANPDWFATRDNGSFFRCGDVADGQQGWNHPYWGTRCVFTDYLPAFDFDNSQARAWSVADALWWAKTFNIDGYRLDAIKHVSQTWLTDLRAALTESFPEPDGGRFYLVGETFDYFDKALLKAFVDVDTKLDGQFDFPLKKRLCEGVFRGDMPTLQRFMDEENRGYYGERALMTTWIGNHDIPRAIHYATGEIENCTEGSNQWNGWNWRPAQPTESWAYERLGLAFGVMFTTEGIPLIYYGDEIGLAGGGDPDNRRLMPWNAAELQPAQRDLRDHLAKLAQVRFEHKSLSRGTRQTLRVDQDSWVFKTSCQDERFEDLTVVINRGDNPMNNVAVPSATYVDLLTDQRFDGVVSVAPRSMLILRRIQE